MILFFKPFSTKKVGYAVSAAMLLLFPLYVFAFNAPTKRDILPISYWLWAGITANDAPSNSEYYIYQGIVTRKNKNVAYQHIGLFPYPLKAKKIFLVYRIKGPLPDPIIVWNIFEHGVTQWQRHPITISGLQLDFDSPTSRLLIYSDFLKQFRALLPKQYALSITGLGDWALSGNKQAMQTIAQYTDELVFQLYQGRKSFPDIRRYIKTLAHYSLPFRVGLLASDANTQYTYPLMDNPNFRGIIYFIQRKR